MNLAANAPDLKKLFELWVDSDPKVQLITFFHNNPGVIETFEGLARRLGLTTEPLRQAIDDEVKLGFLRQRSLGNRQVLYYDRHAEDNIHQFITEKLRERRLKEAA